MKNTKRELDRCSCAGRAPAAPGAAPAQIAFHLRQIFARDGRAGDQHQIHRPAPVRAGEGGSSRATAAGRGCGDGAADFLAGHDAQAAGLAGRARQHVGDQAAADQAPPLCLGADEFAPLFQAAGTGKNRRAMGVPGMAVKPGSGDGVRRGGDGSKWRGPFGGIAVQEAMLAFAPDFRRLILAFHVFILSWLPWSAGSNTPARGESAFRSLKTYRCSSKCQPRNLAHPCAPSDRSLTTKAARITLSRLAGVKLRKTA